LTSCGGRVNVTANLSHQSQACWLAGSLDLRDRGQAAEVAAVLAALPLGG
jgi:hypothetical protein